MYMYIYIDTILYIYDYIYIYIKVAPNTPNTRGGTWLIKWLNDKFPSLVVIIYIMDWSNHVYIV